MWLLSITVEWNLAASQKDRIPISYFVKGSNDVQHGDVFYAETCEVQLINWKYQMKN